MKIIDLLNKIANGEDVPKRIRYDMLEKGFDILVYDEDAMEYRYESDDMVFWREPNHHLNDEIEIIEDTPKEDKKIEHFDITKFINQIGEGYNTKTTFDGDYLENYINKIIDRLNGEDNEPKESN